MGDRVMLGIVIGLVALAGFPINVVLFLFLAVADPEKAHVKGLGALLLDSVVGQAGSSAVVGLDRGRRLFVAEVFQTGTDGDTFLAIEEQGASFGFRSAGNNTLIM